MSSNQGHYRVAEFKMHGCKPTVIELPIHLPEEQQCTFHASQESAKEALSRNENTMLTAYFDANANYGEEATALLYEDFPSKFTFCVKGRMWSIRTRAQAFEAVGRMKSVHPRNREAYFLRLLLKNRMGATSFDELKTVEDVMCPDFHSACIALGLCEDDKEWFECLNEAREVSCAPSIRHLFCTILLQCAPSSPEDLYEEFKGCMSDDFLRKRSSVADLTEEERDELVLNDLSKAMNAFFQQEGKECSDFKLPMPNPHLDGVDLSNDDPEWDPNAESHFNQHFDSLTDEQQSIFDSVVDDLKAGDGGLHRVDAPGGSGKTFWANLLLAAVRMEGGTALSSAMSGIAASLLTLGKTFHRQFGAPIPCHTDSSSNVSHDSYEAEQIRQAILIMIDEVSMMSWKLLSMLDRFLRSLMKSDVYMGGKVVVLMGDMRQCPPVVPGGGRPDTVDTSLARYENWHRYTMHRLTKNMRVERLISTDTSANRISELRAHADWLLAMGNGKLENKCQNLITIPKKMVCISPDELEEKVYDDFEVNYIDKEYLLNRLIMSSTNDCIQEKNFKFVDQKLPGDMIVSYSRDECVEMEDRHLYDSDYLNRMNVSGLPPHRLPLKVNAVVILIRNLDVKRKHCNGTFHPYRRGLSFYHRMTPRGSNNFSFRILYYILLLGIYLDRYYAPCISKFTPPKRINSFLAPATNAFVLRL